jgi:tetratricopeptide (TPR) repeat protein
MGKTIILRSVAAILLVNLYSGGLWAQSPGAAPAQDGHDRMPITTSSPEARALFDEGIVAWENLHIRKAMECWQAAIQKDPNFLLPHLYMLERTPDFDKQAAEQKKITAMMSSVTLDERLMAEWILAENRNDVIAAVAAMNELMERNPRDKHLLWFAALSLGDKYKQWERAAEVSEQALKVDPDFAGALNNQGYNYAYVAQFDKAFLIMQHYIEVLPGEPNPQDSYAEILRMAGHFDEALEHYNAALRIDPRFGESLVGLADTYALMGNEDKARERYDIAIEQAYSKTYTVMWKLRRAETFVREKRFQDADAAYENIARLAQDGVNRTLEARAYRNMALYQHDYAAALRWLQKAEQALAESNDLSLSARQEQLALIARTRIYQAIHHGHQRVADDGLAWLKRMADESHNPNIEVAYHASAGMVLIAGKKWLEAIPHLEEDARNPFSMKLLVTAYREAGLPAKSERMAKELASLNIPTIEQALVVPEFKAQRTRAAGQPALRE